MKGETHANNQAGADNFSMISNLSVLRDWSTEQSPNVKPQDQFLNVSAMQLDRTSDGEHSVSPISDHKFTLRPILDNLQTTQLEPKRWVYHDHSPKDRAYEIQKEQKHVQLTVLPAESHTHEDCASSTHTSDAVPKSESQMLDLTMEGASEFIIDKSYTGIIEGNLWTRFKRQQISGFYFLPSIRCAICFTSILGILLICMGVVLLMVKNTIVETEVPYGDSCAINSTCLLPLSINYTISAPVYVYIKIGNYYQNHHAYIKSMNSDQLTGFDVPLSDLSGDCTPIITVGDLSLNHQVALSGMPLSKNIAANPCGLFANSFFTDTFNLLDSNNFSIPISTTHIAWSVHKDDNFKRNPNYLVTQWTDVEDERFMNWMNFATLYNWKKLWGRIDSDLSSGSYLLAIKNTYDVSTFQGKKSILFSNVSVFGGTNTILAVICSAVGSCYLFLAVILITCTRLKRLNSFKYPDPCKGDWGHVF